MNEVKVRIRTERIKLDQLLKFAGAAQTGGAAKEMIGAGEVSVNGEICLLRGKKLFPGDCVEAGGVRFRVEKDED